MLIRRLGVLGSGIFNIGATASIVAGAFIALLHWGYDGYLLLTIDSAIRLSVTWLYKQRSKRRQQLPLEDATTHPSEWDARPKKTDRANEQPRAIACVVGWREDEQLYADCLRGVSESPSCAAMVAGIDGDGAEDELMVEVFQRVYPDGVVIRLNEPLSEKLSQYVDLSSMQGLDEDSSRAAMGFLCHHIRDILTESLLPMRPQDVKAICVVQPHRNKKDILLTVLAFATVLAQDINIEYIFSTDSDSIVLPDSMGKMTAKLASDENIGGVSGHLRFFNPNETFISRMASSHTWFNQEVAKVQGAMWGITECVPGPCAAFRIEALRPVLVPWYGQTIWGKKMITNEDRHLTTRIICAGYSVHYAPDGIIYSHTPNSFSNFIKQQVRWSRGTMLETIWYPRIISRLSPWHVYEILKARLVFIFSFWAIMSLAFTANFPHGLRGFFASPVFIDVFCGYSLQVAYVVFLGADISLLHDLLWLVPSLVWYYVTMPGIVVWSLITIFDGSWATPTRGLRLPQQEKVPQFRVSSVSLEVAFVTAWLFIVAIAAVRNY